MGLRLERHLEKLRNQYKAQKDEEETKRQFYHSPGTVHKDGADGSSEGQLDDSMELSSHSEQTPEPSPALQQRTALDSPPHHHSSSTREQPMEPKSHPPQVAPRPNPQTSWTTAPTSNGGRVDGRTPPTSPAAYNPYPPPSHAAPPSPLGQVNRLPSPQQPAPIAPQQVAPPMVPPSATTPDKEALFAFAWYHGSIPRDEALHRLEEVGGYDG